MRLRALPLIFLSAGAVSVLAVPAAGANERSSGSASAPLSTSSYCHTGDPLAGVYSPSRLVVLSPCEQAVGTVVGWHVEHDSDIHIKLGGVRNSLLNSANHSKAKGNLIVEIIPSIPATTPRIGQRIAVTGPWVKDKGGPGWNEIHPVWHITVLSSFGVNGSTSLFESPADATDWQDPFDQEAE